MDDIDTGRARRKKSLGKDPAFWAFAFGLAASLLLGLALLAVFWRRLPVAGSACLAASSLFWGLCTWMTLRHLSRGAPPR